MKKSQVVIAAIAAVSATSAIIPSVNVLAEGARAAGDITITTPGATPVTSVDFNGLQSAYNYVNNDVAYQAYKNLADVNTKAANATDVAAQDTAIKAAATTVVKGNQAWAPTEGGNAVAALRSNVSALYGLVGGENGVYAQLNSALNPDTKNTTATVQYDNLEFAIKQAFGVEITLADGAEKNFNDLKTALSTNTSTVKFNGVDQQISDIYSALYGAGGVFATIKAANTTLGEYDALKGALENSNIVIADAGGKDKDQQIADAQSVAALKGLANNATGATAWAGVAREMADVETLVKAGSGGATDTQRYTAVNDLLTELKKTPNNDKLTIEELIMSAPTQKPGDNQKPGDDQKPGDSQKPGSDQKPGDAQKPAGQQPVGAGAAKNPSVKVPNAGAKVSETATVASTSAISALIATLAVAGAGFTIFRRNKKNA